MIITKTVDVGLSPKNCKYYEAKGYHIPRKKDSRGRVNYTKGTKIEVRVPDLMPTSKVPVLVKCEICNLERSILYDTVAGRENSQYLVTGQTLCVRCSNKKLFSGSKSPVFKHGNNRYAEYRWNAKKRGIEFHLDIHQFESLVKQECHYCGGFSIDSNPRSRGNGIDRMDSSKHYEMLNCVPCCSTCNFVKNSMPYNDFISYIKRLYEKVKDYEI